MLSEGSQERFGRERERERQRKRDRDRRLGVKRGFEGKVAKKEGEGKGQRDV